VIRGVYHHTSTSIQHVMRCKISSTTSNDTAPAISCVWDNAQLSECQDTERPRTYIRSGVVLRHKAYELEDGVLGRDGRGEREMHMEAVQASALMIRSRVLFPFCL